MPAPEKRIEEALELAQLYGQTDGDHHKAWVIDQIVQSLLGTREAYEEFLTQYNFGENGPNTYCWEEGIAP